MEELNLCFVNLIGKNSEDKFIYEFCFTNDIENSFGINYEYSPCCLCNEIIPNADNVVLIKQIVTDIEFGLVQNNCCFSMQDCIDGIVSMCWEDISGYEEYPEEGRLVFHFGDDYDYIESKLSERNILFENGEVNQEE